jgi:hypothetical protein
MDTEQFVPGMAKECLTIEHLMHKKYAKQAFF